MPLAPARIAATEESPGFGRVYTGGNQYPNLSKFMPGQTRTIKVTGVGGVPTTNVGAVVIDIAGSSTADSRQYVYPGDESKGLASLSLPASGETESTTIFVRPDDDGLVSFTNEAGSTSLNVDVQGYFTKTSTGAQTGGYVPTTPKRLLTSTLTGGTTYPIQAGGWGEIPANATAIYANIRASAGTGVSGIRAVASNLTPGSSTPALVNFEPGGVFDSGAAIDLGPDGKFKLWSLKTVNVGVEVQGYFTAGADGSSFHPISNTRIYDTSTTPGATSLAAGEARTVKIGGRGGIPDDLSFGSAILGVTAKDWTGSGQISVTNADLDSDNGTSSLYVGGATNGVAKQSTTIVEASSDNEVTIRNRTNGSVTILLNVQGWFELQPGAGYTSPAEPPAPTSGPIDLRGKILDSGQAAGAAKVRVTVWPTNEYLSTLQSGATVPMWTVGNATVASDGSFTASFNTATLPSQFKTATGEVNVELNATNGTTDTTYGMSATPTASAGSSARGTDASTAPPSTTATKPLLDVGTGRTADMNDPASEWDSDQETGEVLEGDSAASRSTVTEPTEAPREVRDFTTPETQQVKDWRNRDVDDANAATLQLLQQQQSRSAMPSGTGTTLDTCVVTAGEWKYGQYEKFGSVYNWKGAKVKWTQSTSSKHVLGIAYETGNYVKAGGSSTIQNTAGFSHTKPGVVNKTYWNRVNYRAFAGGCQPGVKWKPMSFHSFFQKSADSVKKTWNKGCSHYGRGEYVDKVSGKSYTKEDGVELTGLMKVNAQSGYDKGTMLHFDFSAKTTMCATNDAGVVDAASRGIRAFATK